jgi:hypothetical protein
MKRIIAAFGMVSALLLTSVTPAHAIDSFDIGVEMAWSNCLPKKVTGTFKLQTKLAGTSNWVTQGTAAADDGSGGDGSECARWEYSIFWTPREVGTLALRVINGSKVYESSTIRITNTGPHAVAPVQYVSVPNVIGSRDGAVRTWLQTHGYKFTYDIKNIGGNPKLSCLMSGKNIIQRQSPAPGARVPNKGSTWLYVYVDCEWRY